MIMSAAKIFKTVCNSSIKDHKYLENCQTFLTYSNFTYVVRNNNHGLIVYILMTFRFGFSMLKSKFCTNPTPITLSN